MLGFVFGAARGGTGVARFSTRAFSFANGEVSPYVQQRADMEFYFSSLKKALNFIPDQFGNLHRRAGTRFVSQADACPCFYRFDAGESEPLHVLAYANRFDFMLDGALIGQSVETPYTAAEFCDLSYVEDCGAAFLFHPNHPAQKLIRTSSGFEIGPLEASPLGEVNKDRGCSLCLGAGGSADGGVVTLRSRVCAVGDVLLLTRDDGVTNLSATVTAYNGAGVCEVSGSGLAAGEYDVWDGVAVAGSVSLSIDRATLTAKDCAPFTADMVGQQICVLDQEGAGDDPETKNDENTWVTVTVLEFTSASSLVVEYDGFEIACSDLFQLPAFYGGNYPSYGWIMQDRLYMASKNCIAASAAGNFFEWKGFDADGTVNPDNAIYEKIGSGRCSNIKWMQSFGRQLLIGSSTSVSSLMGAGVGGAFQADGTGQQVIEEIGVAAVRPVAAAGTVLFLDAARKRLYATAAGAQYDQVAVSNKNIFADHIGDKCIKKIAYQEHPFPIIWAVTDDGGLYSMTFWAGQAVCGWSRHRLGGSLVSGGCEVAPFVCDVEVQKTSDRSGDVVLFAVKRTVSGKDVYFLETLGEFFGHYTPEEDAHFVDAALPLGVPARGGRGAEVSRLEPVISYPLAPSGRVAVSDGVRWFYGRGDVSRLVMDTPNTFEAVAGRSLVAVGDGWERVLPTPYGKKPEYYDLSCCLYDPPCSIKRVLSWVEKVAGLEHLEGQEVVAYLDAQDCGAFIVENGSIDAGGCVGWVGLPYISEFEPLAWRAQMGTTDGANDPSKVVTLGLNLYRTPMVEIGSLGPNEFMGTGDNYALADLPEAFTTHNRAFHTGWVSGIPFTKIGNNDDMGVSVRIWGPWPAIFRGVEATFYASGGK